MLGPKLDVSTGVEPGLSVDADADLLYQILHNLISNATKYNIENGRIRISAAQAGDRVEVLVANTSHGIPEQARARLFERFYRVDAAHSRVIEGVGLA